MKVCTVARETVWELTPADLRNEQRVHHVATQAAVGDCVYCPPPSKALGPVVDRVAHDEPNEDSELVRARLAPKPRLDMLRAALRARGRDLIDEGCFYHRVVQR